MTEVQFVGLFLSICAGISIGLVAAPVKFMKNYRYEHWAFIYALFGLIIFPWLLSLICCENLFAALAEVPFVVYFKANICSFAWGIANILCCLCFIRIGVSLSVGILTGVGLPIGIFLPMIIKGSGEFSQAPSLLSPEGIKLMCITGVIMLAVFFMAKAGLAKEKSQQNTPMPSNGFKLGLIMSIIAGVLQTGLSFAFVYSQGPLVSSLQKHGVSEFGATAATWSVALLGGGIISVLYPLFLICKNKNIYTFLSRKDFCLSIIMPVCLLSLLICLGNGMRLLGPLGASIGFGLYQSMQLIASQLVGLLFGEWSKTCGRTKFYMGSAVFLVLFSVTIMAMNK